METDRREFLATVGAAAFTTSLFTGKIKGANDRVALGFIGVGVQGTDDMNGAIEESNTQVVAICDVYQPNLETAVTVAQKAAISDTV